MTYRKKLIEVALPLDAINEACKPETENPFLKGHPRALHVYWARSPLVACRAILFASLVDDPSNDLPEEEANKERERLFRIIEELVQWENTNNETVLEMAREEIRKSTGGNPPPVLDPFCGRGSIPLEAQRLGLETYASDLNPVAVLITKALVEIPPKFAGRPPVNPDAKKQMDVGGMWKGAAGLAADVRWYGKWMRDRAWERIGHLYPKGPSGGTVIAWLWARTVKCPNPACGAQMPLVRSFWLHTRRGRQGWVDPIVDRRAKTVRFEVQTGKPVRDGLLASGTKVARVDFRCLVCEQTADGDYIKAEGMSGRIGQQLLALAAGGPRTRTYLSPDLSTVPTLSPAEEARVQAARGGFLSGPTPQRLTGGTCYGYGLTSWATLFTARQLVALTTLSDLVDEARSLVLGHAGGDVEYADAIATYLAFGVSRLADYHSTLCTWNATNQNVRNVFVRQAVPMVWDFAEANPVDGKLDFEAACDWVAGALGLTALTKTCGDTCQLDTSQSLPDVRTAPLVCTDPPYYDNIGYGDITDFFYVWLRRCIGKLYTDLFSTLLTPKESELVAVPYRFAGDRHKAEKHFEEGMAKAFLLIRAQASPHYPLTLYYAFRQEEEEANGGGSSGARASTGWDKMLSGLLGAGYQITGTWPMRTTKAARAVARNTNALASAVVLVCRPRSEDAPIATRREFLTALREELPKQLRVLLTGRVAPVDLAQATIGPGMAVFSRYSKVLEADGGAMSVRTALQLINQAIEDYFTEQEGELDAETQFCVRWFEQHGTAEGPFGDAETLAKAKNVAVDALKRLGLLEARAGKARIAPRSGYSADFDPAQRPRLTVWEACQRLVATLEDEGETETARLARRLGGVAERARDLAYRLYSICDRKGWAEEAFGYNTLVASWPEIQSKAAALAEETQAPLPEV